MIKVALMGCGRISRKHAEILGRHEVNGISLAGVCDPDEEKRHTVAQKYGVPSFSNIEELVSQENVDAVAILTESGNHARHANQVASLGKHVIVEKPMALSLEDSDAMVSACKNAGVQLFVVKQNRFNLPVIKLKEAIDDGRFGQVVMGTVRVRWCRRQSYYDQDEWRGTWALDGGVLTNQASHHIDLLQWMLGDVESVFAKGNTALANIETEDTAVATLKFTSGALGVVEATTATRPTDLEGSLSILGEKGTVVIGGFAVNEMVTWNFEPPELEDKTILNDFSVNPPDVYGFGHRAYYESVRDTLNKRMENPINGEEGRKSLELIHAMYRSMELGREVRLSEQPTCMELGNNFGQSH